MFEKYKNLWNSTSIVIKTLAFLGFVSLGHVIITVFAKCTQMTPADETIRSVMSSIFGFLIGSRTGENTEVKNKMIQTYIAVIVSIICLIVIIASHWAEVPQETAAPVEIRNLLFSAIGFLLSRAKHNE